MASPPSSRPPPGGGGLPPINFRALAEALLTRAHDLVPQWLPGGAKRGHEWVCGSLSGGKGGSFSVNLTTGEWADFADDDLRGGDLLGLYAAIHDLGMGKAARQVAREEGLESVAGIVLQADGTVSRTPPRPPPPETPKNADAREPEGWRTQLPVPEHAPAATFRHYHRQAEDITHTAAYRSDGHLLGYVVRFRTADGGKETLPYTWCVSARDGSAKWHWRQWDEPRPLFLPGGRSPAAYYAEGKPTPTIVLVEGERKAEMLQALLDAGAPGVYLVVSWPGGSKAWDKAAWDWLDGCTVLLWPDCDAKREQLTKKERESCADDLAREVLKQAKPLLPARKQPGLQAMHRIGAHLRDEHMCQVQILPIPEPGAVVDGWDAADAIEVDGWDFARVQAFFGGAGPLPPPEGSEAAGGTPGGGAGASGRGRGGGKLPPSGEGPPHAGGEGDDALDEEGDAFARHLLFMASKLGCEVHQLPVTRKLIIAALRKSPHLQGCLAYSELTDGPCTRHPWPWRDGLGPLAESDDLRLGDFLCTKYGLKAASRAALTEAIDTVADERRFHPIREWLGGLKHDGTSRIDKWLIHVLGMHPDDIPAKRLAYLQLVGRYMLLGLVARVMTPGCKFDYAPVLEGKPNLGKSTLIQILVGKEFFSDTHFDIGQGKDGPEQLGGLWAYELSELTALRRADSEQIKQFFSSQVDRYRGAYGKYVQAHPRQVVIFCSTNKRQYLYDLTGNRRFWPFRVVKPLNLAWLQRNREQLFAEALALFNAGTQYWPTREQEAEFFEPEQRKRLVETAVQSRLYTLLTREGANGGESKLSSELSCNTSFVTLDQMVAALGTDAAKSTAILEGQIRGWLEAHGWIYGRESTGLRRRGYRRPKEWPPAVSPDDEYEEDEEEAGDEPASDGDDPAGAGGAIDDGGADDAPF